MTDLRAALIAAGLTGPYHLEWPAEQGGMFTVWGTGWAVPLVAAGVEAPMRALCDHLNGETPAPLPSKHESHPGDHVGYACGFSGPHCWTCFEPWPCRAALADKESANLRERRG